METCILVQLGLLFPWSPQIQKGLYFSSKHCIIASDICLIFSSGGIWSRLIFPSLYKQPIKRHTPIYWMLDENKFYPSFKKSIFYSTEWQIFCMYMELAPVPIIVVSSQSWCVWLLNLWSSPPVMKWFLFAILF